MFSVVCTEYSGPAPRCALLFIRSAQVFGWPIHFASSVHSFLLPSAPKFRLRARLPVLAGGPGEWGRGGGGGGRGRFIPSESWGRRALAPPRRPRHHHHCKGSHGKGAIRGAARAVAARAAPWGRGPAAKLAIRRSGLAVPAAAAARGALRQAGRRRKKGRAKVRGHVGRGVGARMIWHTRAKLKCTGMRIEGGGAQAGRAEVCGHAGGASGPARFRWEWCGGQARVELRCAGIQKVRTRLRRQTVTTGAQACRREEGSEGERARGKGRAEVRERSGGSEGGVGWVGT